MEALIVGAAAGGFAVWLVARCYVRRARDAMRYQASVAAQEAGRATLLEAEVRLLEARLEERDAELMAREADANGH